MININELYRLHMAALALLFMCIYDYVPEL